MIKIIETHLLFNQDWDFKDHQSRVIEFDDWEKYVDFFRNYNGDYVNSCISAYGCLMGVTLPKHATIKNLEYDNYHLSCDVILFDGSISKTLAYLIEEPEKLDTICSNAMSNIHNI